jgi:putative hydrolase of the HAD superfamily
MSIRGVIFDLGGVILESPMEVLAEFEKAHGLSPNFLNHLIVARGADGAWARLERGEISLEAFFEAFDREIREAGADISSREVMGALQKSGSARPEMLRALRRIREAGYRTAALTNNWIRADGGTSTGAQALRREFDVFVESSRAGVAKPDPRIYEVTLEKLGLFPGEAVFLDDIGRNLKPARQMGMATIKVENPEGALAELGALLGLSLGDSR